MYHNRSATIATRSHRQRSSQAVTLTGHVGLVVRDDLENDLPAGLMGSIGRRLRPQGLSLQLQELQPEQLDRGLDIAEWRTAWGLEGLLVYHQRQAPMQTLQRVRASRTPCVWCNLNGSHDCVYYDEHSAAVEAVRLLVHAGHRRIAFASFRPQTFFSDNHYAWRERLNGYRHAMVEAGLDAYAAIGGPQAVHDLLTTDAPPTAILTPYHDDAFGTIRLATTLDRQVPRDCSLVTFSDRAQHFPGLALTTMVTPIEFLGSSAVDLLLRQFELGEPVPSVGIGYDSPMGDSVVAPPI